MPTPTYTLIASTTLTGSQATVTFSSIPSTYTDLVLRISARNTGGSNAYPLGMNINFNGDSTSLYSGTFLIAQDGTASSSRFSSITYIYADAANSNASTSNTFSNVEIYIPSYTASQNKPLGHFGVTEQNATTANIIEASAGLYRSTTAISSIAVNAGSNNFATGSTFYLYGIKNS